MAKLLPLQDPIANEFVENVLSEWNGDLGFSPSLPSQLKAAGCDVIDLLRVIENGATTSLEKESAHATVFERFGAIEDGTRICVTLSFDFHLGLTIVGFSTP